MSKTKSLTFKLINFFTLLCFCGSMALTDFSRIVPPVYASTLNAPAPENLVSLSPNYSLPILKGLRLDPKNPLQFEFIIDAADQQTVSEEDAADIIKYFLAGLTIPQEDIWVNLSPYEKNRITSPSLAGTDAGKDLLAQDFILKQLSASLTYPETALGKKFWDKIDTVGADLVSARNFFNKIWIAPDACEVYEAGDTAYLTKATLKTMMEEDYLALERNQASSVQRIADSKNANNSSLNAIRYPLNANLATQIMREVILPQVNQDVNYGKNFAKLRQIYNSLVMALWFKQKLAYSVQRIANSTNTGNSSLNAIRYPLNAKNIFEAYIDKNKLSGIDLADKNIKEKVYNQYLKAFRKGVYNYIKKETPCPTPGVGHSCVPPPGWDTGYGKPVYRRYFSGGFTLGNTVINPGKMQDYQTKKEFDLSWQAQKSQKTHKAQQPAASRPKQTHRRSLLRLAPLMTVLVLGVFIQPNWAQQGKNPALADSSRPKIEAVKPDSEAKAIEERLASAFDSLRQARGSFWLDNDKFCQIAEDISALRESKPDAATARLTNLLDDPLFAKMPGKVKKDIIAASKDKDFPFTDFSKAFWWRRWDLIKNCDLVSEMLPAWRSETFKKITLDFSLGHKYSLGLACARFASENSYSFQELSSAQQTKIITFIEDKDREFSGTQVLGPSIEKLYIFSGVNLLAGTRDRLAAEAKKRGIPYKIYEDKAELLKDIEGEKQERIVVFFNTHNDSSGAIATKTDGIIITPREFAQSLSRRKTNHSKALVINNCCYGYNLIESEKIRLSSSEPMFYSMANKDRPIELARDPSFLPDKPIITITDLREAVEGNSRMWISEDPSFHVPLGPNEAAEFLAGIGLKPKAGGKNARSLEVSLNIDQTSGFASSAGGALKDIGTQDEEKVPKEWEELWRREAQESETIANKILPYRIVKVSTMPRSMLAWHLKSSRGQLIIPVQYDIDELEKQYRGITKETIYHEMQEDQFKNRIEKLVQQARRGKGEAFMEFPEAIKNIAVLPLEDQPDQIQRLAHRIAGAKEALKFGKNGLSPYHKYQLDKFKNARVKLLGLAGEDAKVRWQIHQDIKPFLTTEELNRVKEYEFALRQKVGEAIVGLVENQDISALLDPLMQIGARQLDELSKLQARTRELADQLDQDTLSQLSAVDQALIAQARVPAEIEKLSGMTTDDEKNIRLVVEHLEELLAECGLADTSLTGADKEKLALRLVKIEEPLAKTLLTADIPGLENMPADQKKMLVEKAKTLAWFGDRISTDLGGQVSDVKHLDSLLKWLRKLPTSKEVVGLKPNAADREIVEFCIAQLRSRGYVTIKPDQYGNQIVTIDDSSGGDELSGKLIRILKARVIEPQAGVKAVNFRGTKEHWKNQWLIVGFAAELRHPETIDHEQKEIGWRQQGFTWQQAHELANSDSDPFKKRQERRNTTIAEVKRIGGKPVVLHTREDLDTLVEMPLLDACKILFDKNIITLSSSANAQTVSGIRALPVYILFDRDKLSAENLRIAEEFETGKRTLEGVKITRLGIRIPCDPSTSVQEVYEKAVRAANVFSDQDRPRSKPGKEQGSVPGLEQDAQLGAGIDPPVPDISDAQIIEDVKSLRNIRSVEKIPFEYTINAYDFSGFEITGQTPAVDRNGLVSSQNSRYGRVINVDVDKFVLVQIPDNAKVSLFSQDHFTCLSLTVRAVKNGQAVLGHAHLRPTNQDLADGGTKNGGLFAKYVRALELLKQGGLENIQIMVSPEGHMYGLDSLEALKASAQDQGIGFLPAVEREAFWIGDILNTPGKCFALLHTPVRQPECRLVARPWEDISVFQFSGQRFDPSKIPVGAKRMEKGFYQTLLPIISEDGSGTKDNASVAIDGATYTWASPDTIVIDRSDMTRTKLMRGDQGFLLKQDWRYVEGRG